MTNFFKVHFKSILLSCFILFTAVFLAIAYFATTEQIPFDNENTSEFNDGWFYEILGSEDDAMPIVLPAMIETKVNETISLSRTIPRDMPGPIVLCFRSAQQSVRVLYNDGEIYSYGLDKSLHPFGKSPGSIWNLVRLPEGCGGAEVKIELTSPYKNYSGTINSVRVGTKASLVFYFLRTYSSSFIICALIFILGIAILIIHFVLIRKSDIKRDMLALACFSILFSLWRFGETKLSQFFTGNQFFITCLTFVTLLLFPIALLKFIASIEGFRYKKYVNAFTQILYVTAFVIILLQIFNISDFIEVLPYFHIILILLALPTAVFVFIDCFFNKNRKLLTIAISFFIVAAFTLMELVVFYLKPNDQNIGSYIQQGVLIFIIVQLVWSLVNALHIIKLSRIANVDALTGCKNRTAYISRIENISDKRNVFIAMADLNNLKRTNDTLGHQAGDDALLRCTKCLCNAFSEIGDIYRIGGDEFVFIGNVIERQSFFNAIEVFYKECKSENEKVEYDFSVSLGYVTFDEKLDETIEDAVRRADQMMYDNKKAFKALQQNENTGKK